MKRYYSLLLAALGALASAAVYSRLPTSIAVHWDLDGNPNGWMPRPLGAFFMPVFLLAIGEMMRALPRADPRAEARPSLPGAYETIIAAVLLLLLACPAIVLAVALG